MATVAKQQCNLYEGDRDDQGRPHGMGVLRICEDEEEDEQEQDMDEGGSEAAVDSRTVQGESSTGKSSTSSTAATAATTATTATSRNAPGLSNDSLCPSCGHSFATFTGAFVHGKKSGAGRLVFPEGSVQVGTWEQGHLHGLGAYLEVLEEGGGANVNTYSKTDGSCDGPGVVLNANGELFSDYLQMKNANFADTASAMTFIGKIWRALTGNKKMCMQVTLLSSASTRVDCAMAWEAFSFGVTTKWCATSTLLLSESRREDSQSFARKTRTRCR